DSLGAFVLLKPKKSKLQIKLLEHEFEAAIARASHPWAVLPGLIGLQVPRGNRWDTCRIPDIVVLPQDQWRTLKGKEAVITLEQTPPILVVEVVSESTKTTDYRYKQVEYSILGIPEYWIVDPLTDKVSILELIEGMYELETFQGNEQIQSNTFPNFHITPAQLLDP
ncbi:MAG: Uma2 family endonuclease, partial [Prochlorothrix sp.]